MHGADRRIVLGLVIALGCLVVASAPARNRELPGMPGWVDAAVAVPEPPSLHAASAILLEMDTGTVLYERRADVPWVPASLTKVMTIHTALEQARARSISLDRRFTVPEEAWAVNMPAGSSLMFLGPGQRVSLRELLAGLAVVSGNDAAVAVALTLGGSVEEFVASMNREADRLGYSEMHFSDPAGLSPENRITAREYADLVCRHFEAYPELLEELYARREFTHPTAANSTGTAIGGPVRQENRNTLLFDYEGVDGLKTGYTEEAGFNMAVTAERGGMRLLAVVLGVEAASIAEGSRLRADDAAALLDYGYDNFALAETPRPDLPEIRVWKGGIDALTPVIEEEPGERDPGRKDAGGKDAGGKEDALSLVVPREAARNLEASVETVDEVIAPVAEGRRVGTVTYRGDVSAGEIELARRSLVTEAPVEEAGVFKRLWHGFLLILRELFG
ncbi:MAG: D-alanyl-D-alanine carboxypeptidase family protein [Spirochaetaceae bacterium]